MALSICVVLLPKAAASFLIIGRFGVGLSEPERGLPANLDALFMLRVGVPGFPFVPLD